MAENAAAFATPKVLGQDETMRQCDRFMVDWLRKADVENIIVFQRGMCSSIDGDSLVHFFVAL